MAVSKISSGTSYHVALARTDFSENLSLPFPGSLKLTGFHSCITMETLLLCLYGEATLEMAEEGDDRFSKTSVQASAMRYKVSEDIFNSFFSFTKCLLALHLILWVTQVYLAWML
jgi:hypothetical protein